MLRSIQDTYKPAHVWNELTSGHQVYLTHQKILCQFRVELTTQAGEACLQHKVVFGKGTLAGSMGSFGP
jgi:hypothetical protein